VGYYDGTDHGGEFQTRSNQNAYGIFDLCGNAEEWVSDIWFGAVPYGFRRGGAWKRTGTIACDRLWTDPVRSTDSARGFRTVRRAGP
jgi:formylglycine-generating enzyme required for sulfatase activity